MKRIGIMVENSRAYGRAMIGGIAASVQEMRDWILSPLTVKDVFTSRVKDFDGIIARIANDRLAERLQGIGIPVVDVFCQKVRPGIAGVDSDHRKIGRMARDFFKQRGFKHTAYCGVPGTAFSDLREAAFATNDTFIYQRQSSCPLDESLFFAERADRTPDARELKSWLKKLPRPVAVFCCNDLRAIQLQQAALAINLRVPEDVSILGVDNDTILCSFATIPTSSIDPNAFQVGYDAARIMRAMLLKTPSQRTHKIHCVKPGQLIERTSTELMPIEPAWLGEILMHIERNMRRQITAKEIFKLAGRSSTYVENIFHKKLHTSVLSYISSVKLREAKRLLADPSIRISEIAYLCGFSSVQYFSRTFSTAFGCNPKSFRASEQFFHQNGPNNAVRDSASPPGRFCFSQSSR